MMTARFLATTAALATAFVLGALIGIERQWRQRTAGLRTNVLVAVGAAAFADLGLRIYGAEGATRIVSYIVSGIGFLGAGVIMKEGAQVTGLNTAATLWASAAVGAFAGVGLELEAALVAAFILAGNTLLRPVVNFVNRRPMSPTETEALYRVHLICRPKDVSDARDLLFDELETHHYPIQEIETLSEGEELVELAAVLVSTTADPKELDLVVAHLERRPIVVSATWTVSALS
ncbi:MAG TPA: MgtC/SapB family protein [Caulobacteraceae bacterium]|jgi:putative Mg2+ transporter-C (MgtC) family protein